SGDHVLGALQPLKADHGDRRRLDLAVLDAAMREGVNLVSRHGRLLLFHAGLHCDADPGVRPFYILNPLVWTQLLVGRSLVDGALSGQHSRSGSRLWGETRADHPFGNGASLNFRYW